eukprot:scaffold2424_cov97-Cylindrotheca_fusiformis.AAC.3
MKEVYNKRRKGKRIVFLAARDPVFSNSKRGEERTATSPIPTFGHQQLLVFLLVMTLFSERGFILRSPIAENFVFPRRGLVCCGGSVDGISGYLFRRIPPHPPSLFQCPSNKF